jgi:hypothetical protein
VDDFRPPRSAPRVLEGYGQGELVIESPEEDAFVLNVARLTWRFGAPRTQEELHASCFAVGGRLAPASG